MARLRVRPSDLKNAALIAGLLAFWFAAAAVAAVAGASFAWLLIVIGFPLSLVMVLVATGSGVRLFTLLVEGAVVGALATMLILVGAFVPFAARWGGRELYDFGGDAEWSTSLVAGLLFWGVIGTGIGAVCGTLAWALKGVQRRPNRGH